MKSIGRAVVFTIFIDSGDRVAHYTAEVRAYMPAISPGMHIIDLFDCTPAPAGLRSLYDKARQTFGSASSHFTLTNETGVPFRFKICFQPDRASDSDSPAIILTAAGAKVSNHKLPPELSDVISILDAVPSPVFIKDTSGNYIGCNSAFAAFLARDKSDIIGKSVYDINPRELAEVYDAQDKDLMRRRGVQMYNSQVMRRGGEKREVLFYKTTFSALDSDSISGIIGTIFDVTEKKKTETSLTEYLTNFKTVFDSVSDYVLIVDYSGKILHANKWTLETLGYSLDEIRQKTCLEIHDPSMRDELQGAFQKITHGCKDFCYIPLATRQGSLIDVETKVCPAAWDGREALITISRDISESKRSENISILRRNLIHFLGKCDDIEAALDAILDTSIKVSGMDSGGIYLYDEKEDSLILHTTKGLSPEFAESVRHVPRESPAFEAAMAGEIIYIPQSVLDSYPEPSFSHPVRHDRITSAIGIPVVHKGNVIACVNLSSHTLTEPPVTVRTALETIASQIAPLMDHVKATSDIIDRERRLAAITSSVKDAIVMLDRTGNILFWNNAAESIFGYSSDEMTGKRNISIIFPSWVIDDYSELYLTFFSSGTWPGNTSNDHFIAVRKDGIEIPVELTASLIHSDGDLFCIGTLRDITEQLKAKKDIQAMMKNLEAANSELESFAYTVSHDLKSPLISMSGFANILHEELASTLDPDSLHYLERICSSATKMMNMIDIVLDYSRIGRIVGEMGPVKFPKLIRDSIDSISRLISEKKPVIEIIGDDSIVLTGERIRLMQVFTNLITNAIKYSDPDKPVAHITISASAHQETGHFFVKDNGIGIHPDRVGRIFNIFTRVHDQSRITADGSGVGLSIVKRVITQHKGAIWVESSPGTGSTFHFTLPLQYDRDCPATHI